MILDKNFAKTQKKKKKLNPWGQINDVFDLINNYKYQ